MVVSYLTIRKTSMLPGTLSRFPANDVENHAKLHVPVDGDARYRYGQYDARAGVSSLPGQEAWRPLAGQ
jgi:hypothetical protein